MVGMKAIEIKKSSMINSNRISTTSMPNVNLIRHHNNTDVHFLPLNIFDDSYASNRTLMNSDRLHRLENERTSLNSQLQLLTDESAYQNSIINHYEHEQHTLEFLHEIQNFKFRLNTLEKERYELEEKVRRLQEENITYKNRLINENNNWIESQSTSSLNGHPIPSSVAAYKRVRLYLSISLKQGQCSL